MAALDEGKVKMSDTIDTYNGQYKYGNRTMTDHNANHGGFHRISLAQAIYGSSNIGVSRAIVKAYGKNPAEFVDKLYKMKLNEPLKLEIPGTAKPFIRHPNDKSHEWSVTTLPWMSVGYETQVPPIYTLTFYNAIANDGKMIRPFFVKSISKNGQIIKEYTTEIINPAICKPTTLSEIRSALLGVVEDKMGTGKPVFSKYVRIAGKSGTAQLWAGGGNTGKHQVAFCGFFPYENPIYSCIVVMREPGIGHASGGHMSGLVFKNIAERVMALNSNRKPSRVETDTIKPKEILPLLPEAKIGYYKAIQTVTTDLNLPLRANNATDWVKTLAKDNQIEVQAFSVSKNVLPNLTGMGAKDAVYILENMGLNVQVTGRGKVYSQNMKPGTIARKGTSVMINLQ